MTSTRTSFRRSDDGALTELTLTLPTELLELLAEAADQAADAYRKGSDEEADQDLAEHVLSPLADLLYRAATS